MINLVEIKATKRSYLDLESNLVIMGLFEEKNLNPNQKQLDKYKKLDLNEMKNYIQSIKDKKYDYK